MARRIPVLHCDGNALFGSQAGPFESPREGVGFVVGSGRGASACGRRARVALGSKESAPLTPSATYSSCRYSLYLQYCHPPSCVPVRWLLCGGLTGPYSRVSASRIGLIRAAGVLVDYNMGGRRHISLKRAMTSSRQSPGDILRHLARKTNVVLALQHFHDGFKNKALTSRPPHSWQKVEVIATQGCRDALDVMATTLRERPGMQAPPLDVFQRPRELQPGFGQH